MGGCFCSTTNTQRGSLQLHVQSSLLRAIRPGQLRQHRRPLWCALRSFGRCSMRWYCSQRNYWRLRCLWHVQPNSTARLGSQQLRQHSICFWKYWCMLILWLSNYAELCQPLGNLRFSDRPGWWTGYRHCHFSAIWYRFQRIRWVRWIEQLRLLFQQQWPCWSSIRHNGQSKSWGFPIRRLYHRCRLHWCGHDPLVRSWRRDYRVSEIIAGEGLRDA